MAEEKPAIKIDDKEVKFAKPGSLDFQVHLIQKKRKKRREEEV